MQPDPPPHQTIVVDAARALHLWAADSGDWLDYQSTKLAVGDFDRDGFSDFAVIAPNADGKDNVYAPDGPGELLLLRGCDWPVCCDVWRDDSLAFADPPDRPLEDLLPLETDDCYRWNHASGAADSDSTVLSDTARPLVFYASPRTSNALHLTKGTDGTVRITY